MTGMILNCQIAEIMPFQPTDDTVSERWVSLCMDCWMRLPRPWLQSVLVVGQAGLAGWNSGFTGPGPSLCWLLVSVDLQAETVGSPALVPVCAGCWSVWTCRLKQRVHRPWSQSVLVVGQCGLAGWNSGFTGPGPSLCWLLVSVDLQAETAGSPALVPVCAGCWSGWTCRLKQRVHQPCWLVRISHASDSSVHRGRYTLHRSWLRSDEKCICLCLWK